MEYPLFAENSNFDVLGLILFILIGANKHIHVSVQSKFQLIWSSGSKVMSGWICEETCTNCQL